MLWGLLMLGGRCFKVESVQTYRIIWKGPSVGCAGNASGHPSEVAKYLCRRRRGYSVAVYPRHVARGLCPGPRVHVLSDGDGVDAKGRETLDKSAQVVLAGGKTPPPQIRRRSTRWAGQVLLEELGTHETRREELSARRSPADGGTWSWSGCRGHGSTVLHTRRGRGGPAGIAPASQPARPVTSPAWSRQHRAQKGGSGQHTAATG